MYTRPQFQNVVRDINRTLDHLAPWLLREKRTYRVLIRPDISCATGVGMRVDLRHTAA